ncbi:NAD(P)/FAD-dependent oxidoreductase [Ruegeria sp.]|uniref:NAD(P)/FAD-dependent oxidoreductase n=1 Tax=Ruegeria sp. TaxID=1879320 RepID=UPI003B5A1DC6
MASVTGKSVIVLGAGVVGVCAALELLSRGADVTLVDRRDPGEETSYGNAGVMATSSLMPLNNPGLWKRLPGLLSNRGTGFRYSVPFLLRNLQWAVGFLLNARTKTCDETMTALNALIQCSADGHKSLLAEANAADRLNEAGWIFLHRTQQSFEDGARTREAFDRFGLDTEVLGKQDIQDLEPGLNPIFAKGLWIKDTFSVDSPGHVVQAYSKLFLSRGGRIVRSEVSDLQQNESGWTVKCADSAMSADQVVVALGPWSKPFLKRFGVSVPMGFERGYHRHFEGNLGNAKLNRPIYDIGGGYVLSQMEQGLRLTTGVELTDVAAEPNHAQLDLAEQAAREAFDLGQCVQDDPWLGSRPTMPDSRPVIGELKGARKLWLAFGHQHIGFSTAPGTAKILADLMEGAIPPIDAAPFGPDRFTALRWKHNAA